VRTEWARREEAWERKEAAWRGMQAHMQCIAEAWETARAWWSRAQHVIRLIDSLTVGAHTGFAACRTQSGEKFRFPAAPKHRASPPHRPREDWLTHPADTSRSNLAAAGSAFEAVASRHFERLTHPGAET
jgi:hypothetical protein